MGRVWRARHTALDAIVAVKLLNRSVDELDATALARFQREARATAKLDSRHVVRVLDAGATVDGTPFLVMEHLRGETVAQRVSRLGRLPLAEIACIVHQATRALSAAHAAGILHRDISAGNLFLSADGDGSPWLKVLDFGVAKLTADETAMTQTGVALGTPRYMSPEQTLGLALDRRADLWALSAVVYEALTGAPPFSGQTPGAVALEISRGNFKPPTSHVPELPAAVDEFMQRAFAKDLEARFGDADALASAFAAAVGTEVEQASRGVDWRPHGSDSATTRGVTAAQSMGTAEHAEPEGPDHRVVAAPSDSGQTSNAPVVRTPNGVGGARGKEERRPRASSRAGWVALAAAAVALTVWAVRPPASALPSPAPEGFQDPAARPSAAGSSPAVHELASADAHPVEGEPRLPVVASASALTTATAAATAAVAEQPTVVGPSARRRFEARRGSAGGGSPGTAPSSPEPAAPAQRPAAETSPLPTSASPAPAPAEPKRTAKPKVAIPGMRDYGF